MNPDAVAQAFLRAMTQGRAFSWRAALLDTVPAWMALAMLVPLVVALARTVRLPTPTELYANGPHVATRQFEIGNVDLSEETSVGIDVSLRKTEGRVKGQINLFRNAFEGYIFDMPTGDEEDELPVFRYVQDDARFSGVEIETHTELWHEGEHHMELELSGDYVRGELVNGGALPRGGQQGEQDAGRADVHLAHLADRDQGERREDDRQVRAVRLQAQRRGRRGRK